MVGIVIGAALCYPTIQGTALQTAFTAVAGEGAAAPYSLLGQSAYQTFLGIPWVGQPIQVVSYQSFSLLHLLHRFKTC